MSRQVPALIRSALRAAGEPLTIATFGVPAARLPSRHRTVEVRDGSDCLDTLMTFDLDLVVSAHEEAAMAAARFTSRALHAPLVCLVTEPPPQGAKARVEYAKSSRGDFNGFGSPSLAEAWGFPGAVVDTDEALEGLLQEAAMTPFCWSPGT